MLYDKTCSRRIPTEVLIELPRKLSNDCIKNFVCNIVSRRTEFLQALIPDLKSPNGHLGSSDVDLGRKTEHFPFAWFFHCFLHLLQATIINRESSTELESSRYETRNRTEFPKISSSSCDVYSLILT